MGKNEAQIKTLLVKRLIKKVQDANGKKAPNLEANSNLGQSNKQAASIEPIKKGNK